MTPEPKVLWATTFSADMWAGSASKLVETFVATRTPGKLVAYTEGMDLPSTPNAEGHRLEGDAFMAAFLKANRAVIPQALGGDLAAPECKCRGGPFDVHSKRHRLPCPGFWFCKNAYRWLRKVRAANLAAAAHPDHDVLMWVDADATFLQTNPPEVVESWFRGRTGPYACAYVKSRRTAIETGVVGYHLRHGGRMVLAAVAKRYHSGRFRADPRWDDCVQLERGINDCRGRVKVVDLATDVGPNNTVIQFSPMGPYLGHDKGHHRRTGVLT